MKTLSDIRISRTAQSRLPEIDFDNVPFGRVFSDHMLVCDYEQGEWRQPQIVPYGAFELSPCTPALHYGQSIFEGMKAYKDPSGNPLLFRAGANFERFNLSADRMVMPRAPENIFMDGLRELVRVDRDWIPDKEGSALYLRPLMFATNDFIGVGPSETYKFVIFTCPVGAYYSEPVKLWVTKDYVRAADGGTGEAKTAGNYAASYYAAKIAADKGYHNVLWLDGKEHRFIEECGTMNVGFVIDGTVVTPELSGTILRGITRDSALTLLRDQMKVNVEERRVSIDEVFDAGRNGHLEEAFGAGTAATIAPISEIASEQHRVTLPPPSEMKISTQLLERLTNIRLGRAEDPYGWVEKL